jgi:hypothetical protein
LLIVSPLLFHLKIKNFNHTGKSEFITKYVIAAQEVIQIKTAEIAIRDARTVLCFCAFIFCLQFYEPLLRVADAPHNEVLVENVENAGQAETNVTPSEIIVEQQAQAERQEQDGSRKEQNEQNLYDELFDFHCSTSSSMTAWQLGQ